MLEPEFYGLVYSELEGQRKAGNNPFNRLSSEELKVFILTLCDLNQRSYERRYRTEPGDSYGPFIKFRAVMPQINKYQLLKYLRCIDYQIEAPELPPLFQVDRWALEVLRKGIESLSSDIINDIEKYKNAKWSTL